MIGVFCKKESRPIKWHQFPLLTRKVFSCLHIYSLWFSLQTKEWTMIRLSASHRWRSFFFFFFFFLFSLYPVRLLLLIKSVGKVVRKKSFSMPSAARLSTCAVVLSSAAAVCPANGRQSRPSWSTPSYTSSWPRDKGDGAILFFFFCEEHGRASSCRTCVFQTANFVYFVPTVLIAVLLVSRRRVYPTQWALAFVVWFRILQTRRRRVSKIEWNDDRRSRCRPQTMDDMVVVFRCPKVGWQLQAPIICFPAVKQGLILGE